MWQTRTICTYTAATAFGGAAELMESAQRIGMTDDTDTEGTGDPSTDQDKRTASVEAKAGSYEAFMATFGRVVQR